MNIFKYSIYYFEQDGDTWYPDHCTVCNCHKGEIVCYRTPCPVCAEGSVVMAQTGECCGKCVPRKSCSVRSSLGEGGGRSAIEHHALCVLREVWWYHRLESAVESVYCVSPVVLGHHGGGGGGVVCYRTPCPVCAKGSVVIPQAGECCGKCVLCKSCSVRSSWGGGVVCYRTPCPVCAKGSVVIPQSGEYCGKYVPCTQENVQLV